MRLGVSYYPERTPRAAWGPDLSAMAGCGLRIVRLGEFAWSAYEPERGRFDWSWLDEAVEAAEAAGLEVVMSTPTATPPVWLMRERPEIMSTGEDGRRRQYGSRRHTCPTSSAYRQETERVVASLAERYGHHQAVTAWQLDNEPGNHDSARCWCDECQTAFGCWLAAQYETIDELNAAWGTRFWSGDYPDFAAVLLPRTTVTAVDPCLLLAHRRFSSDQVVDFIAAQRDLVQRRAPGRDVTCNQYLSEIDVDGQRIGELTGIAAHDSYPTALSDDLETAFVHDLNLGRAGSAGRSWVMEQQPGPINWTALNPPVAPGQVRLWGWQAAMHGVDTLLFFPWQATRAGAEQYHAALLRHDGSMTRAVDEVRALAAELAAAPADLLQRPRADVALLHSFDDVCALDITPHRAGLRHRDLVMATYRAARAAGVEVDVVSPTADLTSYKTVLAPALHLQTPARTEALQAALRAGVLVVLGPRSLVKDEHGCWASDALPSTFAEELGARVTDPLSQTMAVTVPAYGDAPAGPWTDVLEVDEAEVLAVYGGGTWLDGSCAAARRDNLVYAGFSSERAWAGLLGELWTSPVSRVDREVFARGSHTVSLGFDPPAVHGLPPQVSIGEH